MACLRAFCLALLFASAAVNAQFLYNYEQDQPPESEDSAGYDPAEYKYNPPSAVEQHFLRTSRESAQPALQNYDTQPRYEPEQRPPRRQQTARRYRPPPEPVPQQYEPEPEYRQQQEYAPNPPAEYAPPPQPRRPRRRRPTAVRQPVEEQPVAPPKYYGPSPFEKIGLGEPPSGVYVPEDSLLNLLREDSPRRSQPRQVSRSEYTPEANIVADNPVQQVQAETSYRSNPSPYFVQPPPELQRTSYAQPEPQNQQPQGRYYSAPPPQPRQEYVQPQQRQYLPSSQELQQEFRRQRRGHQAAPPTQEPRFRTYRGPRERLTPYVSNRPQLEYIDPHPYHRTSPDSSEEYDQGPRRSSPPPPPPPPPRRSHQAPRRKSRPQEIPVTAAPETRRKTTFKPANLAIAELPDDADNDGIPGVAGVDYPTLHVIPTTSFSCARQPHNGYYADLETSCQVVHLCQSGGVQDSFLCPNGTIFSQEKFSCQWWYKVNCQNAPRYYSINDRLYKVPNEEKNKK